MSFVGNPGECEAEQQNALETEIAAGRVIPLVNSVRPAAGAAGADGDRLAAERERNISVGGGALNAGSVAELRIDGANGLQQLRILPLDL